MDPIAQFELILNILNSVIAQAVHVRSPRLVDLQNIQRALYYDKDKDKDQALAEIMAIREEIYTEYKII
jgi:hypothetical protein